MIAYSFGDKCGEITGNDFSTKFSILAAEKLLVLRQTYTFYMFLLEKKPRIKCGDQHVF